MARPYQLTAVQSVAWHSADAAERETVRDEIRRACLQRLSDDPHAEAVEILDLGDRRVLERVERACPKCGSFARVDGDCVCELSPGWGG